MTSTTTTSSVVQRERTVLDSPTTMPSRAYIFANGASIQVYRARLKCDRWASLVVPIVPNGRATLAAPHSRHIAALNLWRNRRLVRRVTEFPRAKA